MKKLFSALSALFIIFPFFAVADVIILKNGKRIKTKEAWEEGNQVKCYRFGQIVGYPEENVEQIKTEENTKSESKKAKMWTVVTLTLYLTENSYGAGLPIKECLAAPGSSVSTKASYIRGAEVPLWQCKKRSAEVPLWQCKKRSAEVSLWQWAV